MNKKKYFRIFCVTLYLPVRRNKILLIISIVTITITHTGNTKRWIGQSFSYKPLFFLGSHQHLRCLFDRVVHAARIKIVTSGDDSFLHS